jgi:hypothetical protein
MNCPGVSSGIRRKLGIDHLFGGGVPISRASTVALLQSCLYKRVQNHCKTAQMALPLTGSSGSATLAVMCKPEGVSQ